MSRQREEAPSRAEVIWFITHPEVVVDPAVPVPRWGLSQVGLTRISIAAARPWLSPVGSVWASDETKAQQAGVILAAACSLTLETRSVLGEIDRSATGVLSAEEHNAVTAAFFGQPDRSARGWERAVDAQTRILDAIRTIAHESPPGDIAIVAHGAVGTLALCALAGVPIARERDQPTQGHAFVFGRTSHHLIHGWKPIEILEPVSDDERR